MNRLWLLACAVVVSATSSACGVPWRFGPPPRRVPMFHLSPPAMMAPSPDMVPQTAPPRTYSPPVAPSYPPQPSPQYMVRRAPADDSGLDLVYPDESPGNFATRGQVVAVGRVADAAYRKAKELDRRVTKLENEKGSK